MTKKRIIFLVKLVVFLALAVIIGWKLHAAWVDVGKKHIAIHWAWGLVALAGFTGSMLTSALVWRFLTLKMGDTSPTLPLLSSYTYSQMGKYIPGKVVLLLMRVERTARFGMSPSVATLSTLLENALYMISGGLVGMSAIVFITNGIDNSQTRTLLWPVTIFALLVMITACSPPVFYGLVNRVLRRMQKPEIPPKRRLSAPALALAVIAFFPCWICGGLALWGSVQCVSPNPVPILDCWWFAGAYALSVIIGMASFLPGGAGIREAALGAAAVLQFTALGIPHNQAVLLATVVAILQRLFQLIVEMLLGISGLLLSRKPPPSATSI
jgi:glycosyltransferase 2 family protein